MTGPLIVAFYDGDSEVQVLSNFALTPFELDGWYYKCVEGFWQSLKTEIPVLRAKFQLLEGLDAKQMGAMVRGSSTVDIFTYQNKLYKVGSEAHHKLLERAIRAKTAQNQSVRDAFEWSGNRPLRHLLRNRFGTWRAGDSPSLPAMAFERILVTIRSELTEGRFMPDMPIPLGINDDLLEIV